ncbi:hypothetical protein Fmac_001641 [Flemingia macrophylla]|uniref:Transmembrane protein n=1 Tax=Flemingia macrophylla TaxID=520843 RepID=A0ABD1NI93_9FABA
MNSYRAVHVVAAADNGINRDAEFGVSSLPVTVRLFRIQCSFTFSPFILCFSSLHSLSLALFPHNFFICLSFVCCFPIFFPKIFFCNGLS